MTQCACAEGLSCQDGLCINLAAVDGGLSATIFSCEPARCEALCEAHSGLGCFELSVHHRKDGVAGAALKALYERALGHLTRECYAGLLPSCYRQGVMYLEGLGTAPDPSAGEALIRAACSGGVEAACAPR